MSQTLIPDGRADSDARNVGGGQGRRRRKRDKSTLSVTRIGTFAGMADILPDWRELYATGGSGNPYASPEWLMPWARHFAPEEDLVVLAVRRDGKLIGLAPWYFKRGHFTPRRLQLLGSGRHDALSELPQVLTAPGEARSVLRAVMGEWSAAAAEWDWLELAMVDDQGWFEPEWLTGPVCEQGLVQHKVTRAAVVLDLPADVPALRQGLKRNLLESTHRARNRLDKSGKPWTVSVHTGEDGVRQALPGLARLHGARAHIAGRREHPDVFSVPARRAFLDDALVGMARAGQARILTLDVAGDPVAAQLVLLAPAASYIGLSGVDADWWHVSPVTLLQLHAAEAAVELGHRWFNLSVGPSVAKLRWSEQVRQHPEFLVCGPRRSSRLQYVGYRMTATAAGVRREAARHRTRQPRGRKETASARSAAN
ncbi:MAG TPA: GNAT family N-acetyltransferase [Trebonia sp.]|jgi:CelD/BcsL family acetyltransferase involved in cellulose biosynthesis|nr:GNAT family N-acetyltransferase [Trebonia sp.]